MKWLQPKPAPIMLFDKGGLFILLLLMLLGVLLVAKVLMQHQIRDLEATYYDKLAYHADLQKQWGQMMLETAHLTAPLLVEQQAREHLKMQRPDAIHYLILTEDPSP